MNYEAKDIKEPEPCKNDHKFQWVEGDERGYMWQYCCGCDRKLLVR